MRVTLLQSTVSALACILAPGLSVAQTLPEAVSLALSSNPALAAQRAQLEATSERRVQAAAVSRGSVAAEASYTAQETRSRSQFLGVTTDEFGNVTRPGQVAISASQPIWLAGRGTAALGEAEARVAQAEARYRGAAIGVIRDVVSAYADLRRDSRALDIRRTNVATLTRQLEAARARFEVGEITRTDVAQVEARLAAARANLSGAEARLGASRAAIERLIGQPPAALNPDIGDPQLPGSIEQAVLAARGGNPDLQAARAGQMIAEQTAEQVAAETRPRATLTATGSRFIDQGFDGNTGGSVALTARVTMPLYTAGANGARVREAEGGARAARLGADDAERQVVERVSNGWRQLEAARLGRTATNRQVEAARIAFEGAELEQSVGLRTTLDVLIQQQELLEAELALANAERDVVVASYGLSAAIGTLSPDTVGLPASAVPAARVRSAPSGLIVEQPLIAVQRGLDALGGHGRARVIE